MSVVALIAVMLLPVAALGAGPFDDVPDDHTFATDITWLKDSGITKGCNPAQGNTKFCPDNPVTRAQMAAFMNRLNTYLEANFLAIDGTAVDADKLDGLDSSAFMQDGTIITNFGGAGWLPYGTTTVNRLVSWVSVPGAGSVTMPIPGLELIGGDDYGLHTFEFCVRNGTVNDVYVYRSTSAGAAEELLYDSTDLTAGCHEFTIDTDAQNGIGVYVSTSTSMGLEGLTATWTKGAAGAGTVSGSGGNVNG